MSRVILPVAATVVGALLILMGSCANPIGASNSKTLSNQNGSGSGAGGSGGPGTGGSGGETTTSAAPQTVAWQPDSSGFTQFYTNDSSYLQSSAFSVWTWGSTVEQPMTTVEAEVKKLGGDASMGFGIIFDVQDENDFLVLYIDISGYYGIGKVVGGTYTSIVPWTDANSSTSTILYTGYGYANDLSVTYSASAKSYAVSFNGTQVTTFTDSTWSGGACGFIVGISSTESFPDDPVDVRFLQVKP